MFNPPPLHSKIKFCSQGKVNVKNHTAVCFLFKSKQKTVFLANLAAWEEAKQHYVVSTLRTTENPLLPEAENLASASESCVKIGILRICSSLRETSCLLNSKLSPKFNRKDCSRVTVPTFLGWVLLGKWPRILFGHTCFQSPLTLQSYLSSASGSIHSSFSLGSVPDFIPFLLTFPSSPRCLTRPLQLS